MAADAEAAAASADTDRREADAPPPPTPPRPSATGAGITKLEPAQPGGPALVLVVGRPAAAAEGAAAWPISTLYYSCSGRYQRHRLGTELAAAAARTVVTASQAGSGR